MKGKVWAGGKEKSSIDWGPFFEAGEHCLTAFKG